MNFLKIILIYIFVFSQISMFGQNSHFEKKYKVEASRVIEILQKEAKSSIEYRTALEAAITDYSSYQYYAKTEASLIFTLILESSRQYRDEYYRFLLLDATYFSDSEKERIKSNLLVTLDESDPQFYDIVSLYQLKEFKSVIANELSPDFYKNLESIFQLNGLSNRLKNEARPFITLANLGEVSIEDSIVEIINKLYKQCQNNKDSLIKSIRYKILYFDVIPNILGKLNTKKSLDMTLYLMLEEFDLSLFESDDYGSNSLYLPYVLNVILPKVSLKDQTEINEGLFQVESAHSSRKLYVESLYSKIKSNQVTWKKTLIDVH